MRIGQLVQEVHLSQYCPGGLGFPAGAPGAPGRDRGRASWASSWPVLDGHGAQAAGETCVRCGRQIGAAQAVRRRASGDWVHEGCPLPEPGTPRRDAA
jgi:hypothetical protein